MVVRPGDSARPSLTVAPFSTGRPCGRGQRPPQGFRSRDSLRCVEPLGAALRMLGQFPRASARTAACGRPERAPAASESSRPRSRRERPHRGLEGAPLFHLKQGARPRTHVVAPEVGTRSRGPTQLHVPRLQSPSELYSESLDRSRAESRGLCALGPPRRTRRHRGERGQPCPCKEVRPRYLVVEVQQVVDARPTQLPRACRRRQQLTGRHQQLVADLERLGEIAIPGYGVRDTRRAERLGARARSRRGPSFPPGWRSSCVAS
jgi:hypothetical protein